MESEVAELRKQVEILQRRVDDLERPRCRCPVLSTCPHSWLDSIIPGERVCTRCRTIQLRNDRLVCTRCWTPEMTKS